MLILKPDNVLNKEKTKHVLFITLAPSIGRNLKFAGFSIYATPLWRPELKPG